MAKFFYIHTIFVLLVSSAVTKCPYYIDIFNCVNINCNGRTNLTEISSSISDLIDYQFKPVNLLCSLDLSNTGIVEISSNVVQNINKILHKLSQQNAKQESTILKISFSNINRIKLLNMSSNLAFFIYDSQIELIEPNSFRNLKLELYLMNVSFTILNWINLLNEIKLKLLNIRQININKSAFYDLEPIGRVNDLKLYNTYIPILNEQYFIFPLIDSVEQIEIVNCSVQVINSSYFRKFKKLKYLTLSSNNLTKIDNFMFKELDELEFLDIDNNPIEYIHPQAFSSLKKLRTLSINLHFKKLYQHGYQWMYNSLELMSLNDFSLRNSAVISNFCSLYEIVKYLNRVNQNLAANNFANQLSINERRLKLFAHDQIKMELGLLLRDKKLFCSVYFVCIYAKNYSIVSFNAWSLEYFDVCPEVLALNDNIEFICEFYRKVDQCTKSLKVKSESDQNIIDQTHDASMTTIFAKYNLLIFLISFVLVMTAFVIGFFLLISLIRKRYMSKRPRRNRLKIRTPKKRWLDDSLESGYYIVLMNKKHVKI